MKLEKEFNVYLSNLSVFIMKLHNVHWNVEGRVFAEVHQYTEKQYEVFFERLDDVAELCKMNNMIPVSTLKEHLELATIVEEESRKFTCEEALEIILNDFKALREEAVALRNMADAENWFSTVSLLEDHVADYNKNIWFLKATLA